MKRALAVLILFAACGDDAPATPDAPVIIIDAPPIDSPTCSAPMKLCGTSCLDVSADEENCGDCGVECAGGQACDTTCACAPTDFIPATLEPSEFDQFQPAGGLTLAIGPSISAGSINPIIIGTDAMTAIDTDIDLSMVTLGEAPFVAAAYRFDLGTMTTDAAYITTAGTLRITGSCATEIEGTLTGATFRGVNGGFTNPMVDPQGCTITVPTLTFHISTAACP